MADPALNLSCEAARVAGEYLPSWLGAVQAGKGKSFRETQLDVDLSAVRLLISAIQAVFPDDAILLGGG